jgi:hypothetical protein
VGKQAMGAAPPDFPYLKPLADSNLGNRWNSLI